MLNRISTVKVMPADAESDRPAEKDPAAVAMGRKGGRVGGAVRAANMTPAERAAAAKQAASARWAKVAAERETLEAVDDETAELAGRQPKPFSFTLTPDEALILTGAKGRGGQQTLHRRLVAQLANGNLTIELDDRRFGELIRYMTRYGQGGFQGRLRDAFRRVLGDLLSMRPV